VDGRGESARGRLGKERSCRSSQPPLLHHHFFTTRPRFSKERPSRNALIDLHWLTEMVDVIAFVSDGLSPVKEAWKHAYSSGDVDTISQKIFQEEIFGRFKDKSYLIPEDREWVADVFAECLWSTEDCVVEFLLYGNLSRDRVENYKLLKTLKKLKGQSKRQPGIYMQQLVGVNGRSPSASQLLKMVDIMEAYVTGCRTTDTARTRGIINDTTANKIDNWLKLMNDIPLEKTEQGYRRYMDSKPRKTTDEALLSRGSSDASNFHETYSVSRVLETKRFMAELRRRLETIPAADRDKPLEYPLCEVGYSVRCPARLKQHARHSSSNYIMNLTEAIFGAHRAEFGETFSIHQHVICLIWDSKQPEIAEIGFSKLAESFTDNAGGFGHYTMGLNTHRSTTLVSDNEWSRAKSFMLDKSPYLEKINRHIADLEKEVVVAEEEKRRRIEEAMNDVRKEIDEIIHPTTSPAADIQLEQARDEFNKARSEIQEMIHKESETVGEAASSALRAREELDAFDAVTYYMERFIVEMEQPEKE
jgi:vacuolar-type H+-ATPase subunit H